MRDQAVQPYRSYSKTSFQHHPPTCEGRAFPCWTAGSALALNASPGDTSAGEKLAHGQAGLSAPDVQRISN